MSFKGNSYPGELPIKAQDNPIPVTGYFVNGESYRSMSIDSFTPNKGKNMNSGTGKKPPSKTSTKPAKAPSNGYQPNPDGDVSSGFAVKIKESMQQIKDFAKSLEPTQRGRKQGRAQEAAQETAKEAQKVLSATERFMARTTALSGSPTSISPEAQKEAEKEAKKLVSSVTKFVEKTNAVAAATAQGKNPAEKLRDYQAKLARSQHSTAPLDQDDHPAKQQHQRFCCAVCLHRNIHHLQDAGSQSLRRR